MNDLDRFPKTLPDDHIRYFFSNCLIERVYDGDTITVTVDHGFGLKDEGIELRLFGINAPEVRGNEKPEGYITRDWLREKLCDPSTEYDRWGNVTNGVQNFIDLQTVKIGRKEQSQGKYGRYLAILWDDQGINLNWQMVDQGLARLQDY